MKHELIKCDLSLETFFTAGPGADVITRPVIPRKEGQPVYMRGEAGIRGDGNLRPLVAHNTTHVDMPMHFLEGAADLHDVLNNPAYGINRPMLARVLEFSAWPEEQDCREWNGIRYCKQITAKMLPSVEELRQFDALILLTGFGAIMRQGSAGFLPDADGFYHMPSITVEAAQRIAQAGLTLLGVDGPSVECQTQGTPFRMSSDVHPILLGNDPPVFILEGVAGDRIASQAGFLPSEGMLEVILRRANAKGADAATARVFLSFYKGKNNHQQIKQLLEIVTPKHQYG